MVENKILIVEFIAIASGTITICEISTLDHEHFDHAVKNAPYDIVKILWQIDWRQQSEIT